MMNSSDRPDRRSVQEAGDGAMSEQDESFRDLKLDEIKGLLDSGEYDVVDVREGWERANGYIPGSRHVVLSSILANPQGHQFRDKTIFACEVGERSGSRWRHPPRRSDAYD